MRSTAKSLATQSLLSNPLLGEGLTPEDEEPPSPNFHNFSPVRYLHDYFKKHCDVEDCFLLTFLHEIFLQIPAGGSLLDIGSGPTIYQLITAASKVQSITVSDFLADNRQQIEFWRCADKNAFDWDSRFRYVRSIDRDSYGTVAEMKSTLQRKIIDIVPCDVLQENPLLTAERRTFDIVSTHFCPESITSRRSDFEQAVANIVSLVSPSGYLVMTLLKNATSYEVGGYTFPAFPANEEIVSDLLCRLGYEILDVQASRARKGRDYGSLMGFLAHSTKPALTAAALI